MSYCLNPDCPQPQNPIAANFCQTCGWQLRLGDRYRALKPIGEGGFGKTFLAIDEIEPSHPYCVIKQFFPRQASVDPKAIALFHDEAKRLGELGHHPQIPQLLDDLEWNGSQYLIQEFIDGDNLETVLLEDGLFEEPQIRAVLEEMLPILQFIHDRQVIHRDIKPENIICQAKDDRLVLVDFGASKYATATALARTGTLIGSAGYIAPEQAMGKAEFASDLYSLGVTCIHLLTGMHPFDLYSVSEDAWVWRHYLSRPISSNLRQVLDKLLRRATSQRYRTADDVLKALNRSPRLASTPSRRTDNAIGPTLETTPVAAAFQQTERSPRQPQAHRKASKALDPNQPWHCVRILAGHDGTVTAVAISPDRQTLVSGSTDKSIKLWELDTGKLLHTFAGRSLWFGNGHTDRISDLIFSPDGQKLISSSDDGTIKLWDVSAQRLITTLPGHGWVICAVAIDQTGEILASGGGDGIIHLWDLTTYELIDSLAKHQDCVTAVMISPDGQTLISSGVDRTIRLWDLQTDRLINTLKGHSDRVSAIAVSPDWRMLISGSWDRNLRLWDLSRGELIGTIARHADVVTCLAVSPDGSSFASGSEDSSIRIWSLPRGDRLFTLRDAWGVTSLRFSPDGQRLVSGSSDATIKIWQYQPDRL